MKDEHKAIVIANSISKGGVGKTAGTLNLAAALAENGYKCLVIDLDGQQSLTAIVGMLGKPNIINAATSSTLPIYPYRDNIDVTPAGKDLYVDSHLSKHGTIKQLIDAQRNNYDFILCDPSPSITMIHFEVMCAVDYVIIPTLPHTTVWHAVKDMVQYLNDIKTQTGHAPGILGVYVSRMANRNLHKLIYQNYVEWFGELMFKTTIPECVKMDEAFYLHQTVLEYAPKNNASEAFRALANEIITRTM